MNTCITFTHIAAFVAAIVLLSASSAVAGDPVPGVGVGAGKNPGGIIVSTTKTDSQGKFTFPVSEAGEYTITFTAEDVKAMKAIAAKLYPAKPYGDLYGPLATIQPQEGMTVTVNGRVTTGAIALSTTKTTTITIRLTRAASISGTITMPDTAGR